ncbi:hypothetical protein GCM10009839_33990 [Catenulispora yoronensis]|uniref:Aminoglycoside phosphotransferase domain-containing protein n=1 Tax=Catenulispora yoronensis TaxID=450799 RepID=A0ABN2U909_9ACTN
MDDGDLREVGLLIDTLRQVFGDFDMPLWKPYSVNAKSTDSTVRLKIYRGISPAQRQERERAAIEQAPSHGIPVPRLLHSGATATTTWSVFENVAGSPGRLDNEIGLDAFVDNVVELMTRLHDGRGLACWPGSCQDRPNSASVNEQLSHRARSRPWWPELCERLRILDSVDSIRLHGDIKPEHFIASDHERYVVDWEAATVGPAVLDYADFLFHTVRDLIYAGRNAPEQLAARCGGGMQALGVTLAWRVVLWTDRRRPADLDLLPHRTLTSLAATDEPADLIAHLASIIAAMAEHGTPR